MSSDSSRVNSASTLLNIPSEVRQQILDYAIPVQRLAAQSITDHEWYRQSSEARGVPACLFTCKQFYKEAVPIVYSKSILEVAPIRPAMFALDVPMTTRYWSVDLAYPLDNIFDFCPAHLLRFIRTVHVFTGQRDAINAESYEAMLRWLVQNTGVISINLSYLLMTRLRKSRVDPDTLGWLNTERVNLKPRRTVHVFTKSKRSPWEMMRKRELRKALKDRSLPQLQVYILRDGHQYEPVLDPRWDVRRSDDKEHFDKVHSLSSRIDQLMDQDLHCLQARADDWLQPKDEFNRLYQVLFVLASP